MLHGSKALSLGVFQDVSKTFWHFFIAICRKNAVGKLLVDTLRFANFLGFELFLRDA